MIARALHGLPSIQAFLSNKTSAAKLRLMQFFGINMSVKYRELMNDLS